MDTKITLKKHFATLTAFVCMMLFPSIARADAGEDVVLKVAKTVWLKLRLSLVPYLDMKWDMWICWTVSIVCMSMTLVWLWRWKPRGFDITNLVGKTAGPFALIGYVILIGISLVYMAIGIVQGWLTGAITGALGRLPVIGWFLSFFPNLQQAVNALIGAVIGFLFMIGLIMYLVKSAGSLANTLFGTLKGIVEGAGGAQVGMKYKIAGTLAVAALINKASWNSEMFYALSAVSTLLGIYALFTTTGEGQQILDRTMAKAMGAPRADGAWRCPNHGVMPVLDKQMKPVRNERGKVKGKEGSCPGPQGQDPKGVQYDGWNPREASQCLCLLCDFPNPFWQICEKCGFGGKDKKGFPRKPNLPVRCPECRHIHPALPATMKFHLPEQDKSNPATVAKAKAAPAVQPRPQPTTQPRPAAPVDGLLIGSEQHRWSACTACGEDIDLHLGEKFCPHCAAPLTGDPVAPAPVPRPQAAPKDEGPPPPLGLKAGDDIF